MPQGFSLCTILSRNMPGYKQQFSKELIGDTDHSTDGCDVPSNLASKLLLEACTGNISFAAAQSLAHAAFLDGISHPDIISMAQTGNWGQYPSHVKRDLESQFFKSVAYALPTTVKTSVLNTKSNEIIQMDICCFLPHLVIESLSGYTGEHDATFRVDLLAEFWASIRPDDPCLVSLLKETCIQRKDLNMTIPLLIHGDGVEYLENDSLEVQSFGPLLTTSGNSLSSLFLMCAYPYSCTVKPPKSSHGVSVKDYSTWVNISKWLSWSFIALQTGRHPTVGPDGEALTDATMIKLAGKMFKYRYVIWSITGDHEHHSNHFRLPHWKKDKWCWNCDCSHLHKSGYEFKPTERKWVERTVAEEIETRISKHNIFKIPGVTSFNVAHDPLHVLYNHGILSHFYGSCLHMLLYTGPGRQAMSAQERLAIIWQRLLVFYQKNHSESRLTSLKLSMILPDTDAPHKYFPHLKTKAAETKHLIAFMVELMQLSDDGSAQARQRLAAAKSIWQFCKLLDQAPAVPSSTQATEARTTMQVFLYNYCALHDWAKENSIMLFHLVPKFHMAWHMAQHFAFLNPRLTWTFKAEDYVGKISKLAHGCTYGTSRMNVSSSICSKYRCFMHLRLSRGGFLE